METGRTSIKAFLFFLIVFFGGCGTPEVEQLPEDLIIREEKPSKWTALVKQHIIHLVQIHNLGPFLYTKTVRVVPDEPSHSRPVLTINTRFAEQPKKILSTFLHEQLHWWVDRNARKYFRASRELKKIYPEAPVYRVNKESTYVHLIVGYLELRALSLYLGEKDAREIISELGKKDKLYPWVYEEVLASPERFKAIVEKYGLLPDPLKSNKKSSAL